MADRTDLSGVGHGVLTQLVENLEKSSKTDLVHQLDRLDRAAKPPASRQPVGRIGHLLRRLKRLYRTSPRSLPYHVMSTIGYRMVYRLFCLLPLNPHKVFFASDRNAKLTDNFRFVYEELMRRNIRFQYRFMLKTTTSERKTLKQLLVLAYHLATSKVTLLDDFFFKAYGLRIRRNAELVQLWHAVGAFKRFGFSRVGLPGAASLTSVNHRNYTKAIVSSVSVVKHYAEAFGINEEKVIATGVPRTDKLFDRDHIRQVRDRIYGEYPQLAGKKVMTYAPTFRGSGRHDAWFDTSIIDFDALYDAFHEEYICLLKMHPFIGELPVIPVEYQDFFLDVSTKGSLNDWLHVTDILVTDYSSVCFEAALLNIPMLFYVSDLDEYTRERAFYYDFEQFVPGTIVRTVDKWIEAVKQGEFGSEKLQAFVEYFFDHTDGQSSARVVDWIILGNLPDNGPLVQQHMDWSAPSVTGESSAQQM